MTRASSPRLAILSVLVAVSIPLNANAKDGSAPDLLPETTLLYAELRQPRKLLDTVLEHPLWRKIESFQEVRQAMQQKQYLQFRAVVSVIEAELGQTWPKLVSSASAGGMAIGVDSKTSGVAILLKAEDDLTHQQIISSLVNLVRQDAENKGNPDPIETGEYRGITAYKVGEAKVAAFGSWLVVTNKPDLGKQILDNYLDGAGGVLSGSEAFQAAWSADAGDAVAWAFVNLEGLRDANAAQQLFEGDANNPLGELLVGGILSNLQKTPFATAALDATTSKIGLELAAPHQSQWIPEARHYFFSPEAENGAPPLLLAGNTILSVSAYRDISGMWLRAGDLFDERMNDQLAKADSQLSTLFSGKDFGEDILGALTPDVQLVVTRQVFEEEQPQPAIRLPALAMVFRLKDPETMRSELRRIFQSLIGFLNVIGAMNGQPQLDLDIEQNGDLQIVIATYLPDQDEEDSRRKINFNFSPSVAFSGSRFIVSSTKQLARELAKSDPAPAQARQPATNTLATADFQVLREVLEDNRRHLVAQNMLEEGHTKEEAEKEIGRLLELLGFLRDASAQLTTDNNRLKFDLQLDFSGSQ